MAKSLSQLKQGRQAAFESIQEDIKKSGKKDYNDTRFWKVSRNSEGSAFAEIRFLPAPPDSPEWGEEQHCFQKFISHSFEGPTEKYYIENSRKSLGEDFDDPIAEYNDVLWNKVGTEAAKNQARKQKRQKRFVANILVVRDPVKPENNGKVFLYEFGQKIFDKIQSAMAPPAESGRKGINIFDPWDGANFHIEAHNNTVDGFKFLDYAQSTFGTPTPIEGGDDAKITALWEQQHSLNQFVSEKNTDFFKSYDELKKRLETVMGAPMEKLLDPTHTVKKSQNTLKELEQQDATLKNYLSDDDDEDDIPSFAKEAVSTPTATPAPAKAEAPTAVPDTVPDVADADLQGLADLEGLDDL